MNNIRVERTNETIEVHIHPRPPRQWIPVALIWLGIAFNLVETWYFGWNVTPKSTAELICDAVSVAIVLTGLVWPKEKS